MKNYIVLAEKWIKGNVTEFQFTVSAASKTDARIAVKKADSALSINKVITDYLI